MTGLLLSWRRFRAVLIKEFIQMRRDRLTFAMLIGVPLMQLMLFGFAINTDPKHLPTALLLADRGVFARSLVQALENSGYFAVSRQVGSFSIPMTWFQSLNPLMIFLFTPVIVAWWTRAAKQGREPGSIGKMATGGFIVGISYLVLALVAHLSGDARASWLWLVFFFFVYTVGELFILPVGLGLFGKLAPAEFAATAIAAWFMAAFFGNLALVGRLVTARWRDVA